MLVYLEMELEAKLCVLQDFRGAMVGMVIRGRTEYL